MPFFSIAEEQGRLKNARIHQDRPDDDVISGVKIRQVYLF